MHQLKIDPFLLIRSPAYSYEDFNGGYLQQVLQTDFFRASLFFASQTFYTELQKKDFRYEDLSPGARLTLWKYLNRMCYRALPYGFFSSYSAGTWANDGDGTLCFSDEDELIVHPDFKLVLDDVSSLNIANFDAVRYYTNNSLYPSSKELRFISQAYSGEKKKFAIVQLKITPGLNKLLKFISKGRTKGEIISFLEEEYGEEAPLEDYFKGLLSGQVVVSALTPNVTGQLFNERCLELLGKYPGIDSCRLRSFRLPLKGSAAPDLSALNAHISYLAGKNGENSSYSLYQRSLQGGLNQQLQERLVTLIRNMDKLTGDHHIDTMEQFKQHFVQKYDQQEVPLMIALDPGSGIGYENMASAFDAQNEDFIDDLREKKEGKAGARWGAVEKMIFRKWSNLKKEGADRIMISSDDLHGLPESGQQLPPGMFVLFRSIGNELWTDTIGGVSGIELSARFSPSGTEMETSLKKICEQEMALNSDFVFAEIAWSPNDRTSNVNQRGHYYPYEIPILTHAVRPEEFTISLSDLMVSVQDNQLFLRSVKLDRYIIPRLSSAYNYKISAIPVFRFLCDLQYQGIKSNLSLTLSNLFPGMDYYPRLQVEDAVLSPATWVLNEEQLKKVVTEDVFPAMDFNLPGHFCLLEGDNFLVFNRDDENDLDLFRKCVRNKKTATLTEYIFAGSPVLKDGRGKPFAGQFLACVINQLAVYQLPRQQPARQLKEDVKVKRSFLPGEEWLYIKLYAHYSLTDEILLRFIMPVLRKYKKDNPDFKWFFIRYLDPRFHLRLRFFAGKKPSHELLADLIRKLQPLSREGKVFDLVLDSYQRELEKYSVSLIAEAESFFYRNSEFILAAFSGNVLNTNFKLAFAVNSSLQIIRGFITDKKERSDFLNEAFSNLSAEFSRDREVVQKLDLRYRKFQKQIVENKQHRALQRKKKADLDFDRMLQSLVARIEGWDQAARYNLLINLVHLHINRIFENTPREYEYLIYHFMKKHQSFLIYTTSDGS
ncbi:lantibiotic dehydratase [Pedobacter hartonius]|uniref:Thiopeptide-type bacteriocin biosynthesis domain-containing protein n=1 Tax=Pedobacter hartonius TaxID=425514 RepID=A0A1H4AUJ7_9SPHI|nr:lantibiotic dehydratase [Pedobacter hartonius]SEA39516.1 thiopeptide-type bacteriocin biosynthesis domain-containing protein [Pedobacter hartonius]